jgi:MraZ protein
MIIGEYQQKLTDKNRLAFPKKFREQLGNKLIATKSYEGCLIILSPDQWDSLISKSIEGPFTSGVIRDTTRFLLGSASELELDNQGRFVLPSYLKKYALLKEDVVFLGLGRWVELWAKDSWEHKCLEIEKNSTEIGEKLSNIGYPRKDE